jgi:hypothetical protein
MLLVLFLVAVGTTAGFVGGCESAERDATATSPAPSAPVEVDGAAVFASAGCGGCHAFAPAAATRTVSPSLDDLQLAPATGEDVIANGPRRDAGVLRPRVRRGDSGGDGVRVQ